MPRIALIFSHNYHLDRAYNDPRQRQWRGEMENGGVRVRGERGKKTAVELFAPGLLHLS